ncbi:MAG: hypothetical protein ACYC6C_10160, partial [Coriobacteriia bacterium]
AYVIARGGTVSLYRGLPGALAGMELSWLEEETTITPRLLDPVTAAHLAQGIQVEDLEAGRDLLDEYREQIRADSERPTLPVGETLTPFNP